MTVFSTILFSLIPYGFADSSPTLKVRKKKVSPPVSSVPVSSGSIPSQFVEQVESSLSASGMSLPSNCPPVIVEPKLPGALRPGIELKFTDDCNDPPKAETVILIHGMHSDSETWETTKDALCKKGMRVVTYDLRGHGDSVAMGDDYSMEVMAKDLEALRRSLGVKDVHLIGHSYGARIALKYSESFPGRVKSLVLEDQDVLPRSLPPHIDRDVYVSGRTQKALQFPKEFASKQEVVAALMQLFPKGMAEDFAATKTKEVDPGKLGSKIRLNFNPYAAELFSDQAMYSDLTTALRKAEHANIPILALKADMVMGVTAAGLDYYRDHTSVRPKVIPGSKHNIHKSQFAAYMESLDEFYSKPLEVPVSVSPVTVSPQSLAPHSSVPPHSSSGHSVPPPSSSGH